MNDAEDLARRFLALWADYLTALLADPKAAELLQRWLAFGTSFLPGAAAGDGTAANGTGPAHRTAPAAGASRERDDAVAQLARRVDELEQRLAALERRRRPAAGAGGRNRTARS
jgi:hypothetical protein